MAPRKRKKPEPEDQEPVHDETQAAAEPAEEPAAAEEQKEEEGATGDVYSLIQWMILMLAESAWQWMGLHVNPVTKKVAKDLAQARVAIDSVVFLSDQIAPHVSDEQRRAYRALINDLRVNFVQQQGRAD